MSPRNVLLRRVGLHVALAGAGGALLGALDGVISAPSRDWRTLLVSLWVGTGALVPLTAPLGLIQAVTELVLRHAFRERKLPQWWPVLAGTESGNSSPLIVRAHSGAMLGVGALAVVLMMVWRLDVGLAVIQDAVFRRVLLVLAVGIFVVVAVTAVLLLSVPTTRLFAYLDARIGLPWPRSRVGRFALYVLVPVLVPSFAIGLPLLARYGNQLSVLVGPLGLLLFVELQILVYFVVRFVLPGPGRFVLAGVGVVCGVAAALLPFRLQHVEGAKRVVAAGAYTSRAIAVLTRWTDSDNDGFSRWYVGGDCAPTDPTVHAAAIDIPGNGRDENCDGFDAPGDQTIEPPPLFSGTYAENRRRPYNIVWIVVDALRPTNMEVYGYSRKNTPALAQFAKDALVFQDAYSPSTVTHLSLACMLTGRNADALDWEYREDPVRLEPTERHPTLAERLGAAGYRRVAIVSRFIAHLPGMLRGFDGVVTHHRKVLRYDGPGATSAAIDALHDRTADPSRPLFLLVYYEEPHKPYEAHGPGFPVYGSTEQDLYDGEIAFVDRYLGFLFEHLRSHPDIWENTVVVVTSDHGEEFGEHGGTSHGKTCHEESTRVPLLVRIPGVSPRHVERRVSTIDVVPTVLELVGVKAARSELDGRSLLSSWRNRPLRRPCSARS